MRIFGHHALDQAELLAAQSELQAAHWRRVAEEILVHRVSASPSKPG
jgi:hypothetical protein